MSANNNSSLPCLIGSIVSNHSAISDHSMISNDSVVYTVITQYFHEEPNAKFLVAEVLVPITLLLWQLWSSYGLVMRKTWKMLSIPFGSREVLLEGDSELAQCVVQWHMETFNTNSRAWSLVASISYAARGFRGEDDRSRSQGLCKRLRVAPYADAAQTDPSIAYNALLGSTYAFWHSRRFFRLELNYTPGAESALAENFGGGSKYLRVSCIGLSSRPARVLIAEAKEQCGQELLTTTSIYQGSSGHHWQKVAARPSRSLDTVVLNVADKSRIIADMTEYLSAETREWYSNRGIPYRRGYCLQGPPETGKTSLSFGLAGYFNLNLYTVSLQDRKMTEARLANLFDMLPSQCVVLLEDTDRAGIRRTAPESAAPRSKRSSMSSSSSSSSTSNSNHSDGPRGITLSGLLNAIDGVAGHEGRILIMTTNHVTTLDPALMRPGRVDMQIDFTHATKAQIEELFIRMYLLYLPIKGRQGSQGNLQMPKPCGDCKASPREQVTKLAAEFSRICPANAFSPAEIQGYLLNWKRDPYAAVVHAERWQDELLEKKANSE